MLWKVVLVATLAVAGVLGRYTNPYNAYDSDPFDDYSQQVATEYCKVSHAEDKVPQVKASLNAFAKCLTGLFDTDTISRDAQEATNSKNYNALIKKYCSKAPQLKACASDLVDGMAPCLPADTADTALNSTNALIDFVCDNDGARVTSFINEGGPECFQEKQFEFASCQRDMKANLTRITNIYGGGAAGSLMIPVKERCSFTDQGFTCLVDVLKSCSNPTPGRLGQEFHDTYLDSINCFDEVRSTQRPEVTARPYKEVNVAQTLPPPSDDLEQLKKKKLELEVRIAELEMWNRENQLNVQHTVLTSDIKQN